MTSFGGMGYFWVAMVFMDKIIIIWAVTDF